MWNSVLLLMMTCSSAASSPGGEESTAAPKLYIQASQGLSNRRYPTRLHLRGGPLEVSISIISDALDGAATRHLAKQNEERSLAVREGRQPVLEKFELAASDHVPLPRADGGWPGFLHLELVSIDESGVTVVFGDAVFRKAIEESVRGRSPSTVAGGFPDLVNIALEPEITAILDDGEYAMRAVLDTSDCHDGEAWKGVTEFTSPVFEFRSPADASETHAVELHLNYFFHKRGEHAQALEHALKALEIEESSGGFPAYTLVARAKEELGDIDGAIDALEQYLDEYSGPGPRDEGGWLRAVTKLEMLRAELDE